MRARSIAILLIILLATNLVSAEDYRKAEKNDYGAYAYFRLMLDEANSVLSLLVEESPEALNQSLELYNWTNTTVEELITYQSLGASPKALELAYQFKTLGRELFLLSKWQGDFLKAISEGDFAGAKEALLYMSSSIEEIRPVLESVRGIYLVGENGERLELDLNETYETLGKLERLLEVYESRLNELFVPTDFSLFTSKPTAFLSENVTLYGYTLNLSEIRVFVNETPYTPEIIDGVFRLKISFNQSGSYVLYATALNGTKTVHSNSITLNVTRVPTKVVALQKTGENSTVEGVLIDYYGNPVPGKSILLLLENLTLESVSDENGTFIFELPELRGSMNTTVIFEGDEYYAPSYANITLEPTREKVLIRLFFDKKEVRAGERIEVRGLVNGTSEEIPIEVYVDENLVEERRVRGNFTISLTLDEGNHAVYVRFPGNERFSESFSNTIEIYASSYLSTTRIAIFSAFLIIGLLVYHFINRKPVSKAPTKAPERSVEEFTLGEEKPDLLRAYRFLYRFLRRLYNLPKSTTPRELLGRLRGWEFLPELKRVTELHEVAFYGRKMPGIKEVVEGVRTVARIVLGAIVGDEL